MTRRAGYKVAWLAAYAITMAVVVVLLLDVRRRELARLGTPQAQAEWSRWRAEAAGNDDAPVRRRPPQSAEPPALVLLRDHFAVVLAAAIVMSSALLATLAVAIRGVLARSPRPGNRSATGG